MDVLLIILIFFVGGWLLAWLLVLVFCAFLENPLPVGFLIILFSSLAVLS